MTDLSATHRSVKLTSSIGSSSEGSCTLRDNTKPSSACPSPVPPEAVELRRSKTSVSFFCFFSSEGVEGCVEVFTGSVAVLVVVSFSGSFAVRWPETGRLASELSILVNDRVECS